MPLGNLLITNINLLKDHKGRTLPSDELTHYQKVTVALKETIRLMEEIDSLIPD